MNENKFNLIRIVDNEELTTEITQLETIVGRGKLLEVSDKRVSRNHALLTLNSGSLLLKSTHSNPCFLNLKNRNKKILLKKGGSITLQNEDEFSLLQDMYCFKVQIQSNETKENSKLNLSQSKNGYGDVPTPVIADKSDTGVDADTSSKASNNNIKPSDNSSNTSTSTSAMKLIKVFPQKPTTNVISNKSNSASDASRPSKKRKLPQWMMTQFFNKGQTQQLVATTRSQLKVTSTFLDKDQIYENNKNSTKSFCDAKIAAKPSLKLDKNLTNDGTSNIQNLQSSNVPPEQTAEIKDKKTDSSTDDSLVPLHAEKDFDSDTSSKDTISSIESQKNNNTTSQQPAAFDHDAVQDVTANRVAQSSTNSVTHPAKTREPCAYGKSCYRKNPDHFNEYSHPGDADYFSHSSSEDDNDDNRPECEFGLQCYRKNPTHKRKYKHTRRMTPKRVATKQKKDKNNNADDDEDEYDIDDSFIDDDDEEDVSDDSDWAPSGNKKTKRTNSDTDGSTDDDVSDLVSSAKKFVKNRKLWKK